jgi:hypothetical protein
MRQWRKGSEFGPGARIKLDREIQAVWKAKLYLWKGPRRLTPTCVLVGLYLLRTMGPDGRLDPSRETIATNVRCSLSTVGDCLNRLRDCGFLDWTRRLVRQGPVVRQTSNAYVLRVPEADTDFRPGVSLNSLKKALHRQMSRAVDTALGQVAQMAALAPLAKRSEERVAAAWKARKRWTMPR